MLFPTVCNDFFFVSSREILFQAKYNVKKCRFQERILPNNQNTYESLSCSGCYLNLNKRGRVKRLKKSNPNMQETHFLPRSHSETYNRSKRVAFAKRGKTVAIDIANMTTSTSVGAPTQASSTGNVQVSDSYETGTQSEPKSNTRHKRRKSTSADRVKASWSLPAPSLLFVESIGHLDQRLRDRRGESYKAWLIGVYLPMEWRWGSTSRFFVGPQKTVCRRHARQWRRHSGREFLEPAVVEPRTY